MAKKRLASLDTLSIRGFEVFLSFQVFRYKRQRKKLHK